MTNDRIDKIPTQVHVSIHDSKIRCEKLSDALEEALAEDIDNDLYAEVKESMGQIFVIEQWLEYAPGIIMLTRIRGLLDAIEDFIVNQLPKGEDDAEA